MLPKLGYGFLNCVTERVNTSAKKGRGTVVQDSFLRLDWDGSEDGDDDAMESEDMIRR